MRSERSAAPDRAGDDAESLGNRPPTGSFTCRESGTVRTRRRADSPLGEATGSRVGTRVTAGRDAPRASFRLGRRTLGRARRRDDRRVGHLDDTARGRRRTGFDPGGRQRAPHRRPLRDHATAGEIRPQRHPLGPDRVPRIGFGRLTVIRRCIAGSLVAARRLGRGGAGRGGRGHGAAVAPAGDGSSAAFCAGTAFEGSHHVRIDATAPRPRRSLGDGMAATGLETLLGRPTAAGGIHAGEGARAILAHRMPDGGAAVLPAPRTEWKR